MAGVETGSDLHPQAGAGGGRVTPNDGGGKGKAKAKGQRKWLTRQEYVAKQLKEKGIEPSKPQPKTKKDWLKDLPKGWVIPAKAKQPWYKTEQSANTARKIKEKQGQLFEVDTFGEGYALVPVAAKEETGKLKLAPNGKPWPVRGGAQTQANIYNSSNKHPNYRVVELNNNKGFALREVTHLVEGKEPQTTNVPSKPKSDGGVEGGQPEKRNNGRGTFVAGRVSETVARETEKESGGKQQTSTTSRGFSLQRRLAEAGIAIPEISDAQFAAMESVRGKDSELGHVFDLYYARAEAIADETGFSQRMALRYAIAEDRLIKETDKSIEGGETTREEEIEQYLAEQRQQELQADEQLSDDTNQFYDDITANFVDQLTVDQNEQKQDLDGYEKVLPFINSATKFRASAYENIQQLYLKWASASHPTFEFHLTPKDDPKLGAFKELPAKRDRDGRITRKAKKLPFMGVTGTKRFFDSADQAQQCAEKPTTTAKTGDSLENKLCVQLDKLKGKNQWTTTPTKDIRHPDNLRLFPCSVQLKYWLTLSIVAFSSISYHSKQ
ncbi:hypothetical protein [Endozoicomonas sp. 8E]|uniref:hypothetical protein n=1 Tax=Endozoicomonas sp. 8E TaxID=3035692 RepID=UPI002938EEF3|nr:hypothetical protein [Endozoicomonas sp. 8E]WOG26263.1 hypothetical protein P6910_17055 [Endozoicomonas sp. 8E]